MTEYHNRVSPLVRTFSPIVALLIAVQLVIPSVAAAPVHQDDELIVTPAHDEGEEAADPGQEADEEVAAPAQDDGEHAAEPAPEDDAEGSASAAVEDEPAHVEDEAAVEPASEGDEAVSEPASEGDTAAAAPEPIEETAGPVAAYVDDPVADGFLLRLLDAINARRARTGTQRLSYVPARANAALDGFLAATAPAIAWPGPCMHHLVGGAFSWDHVLATGVGGDPRGEVIACPGPEPYWTPDRAAEQWWHSPIHFDVLYADGASNAIACSAQGASGRRNRRGGSSEAASAVLCVTFQR